MTLGRVGYGAGSTDFSERPDFLRVLFGSEPARLVVLLETNLDDMVPELVPDTAEA